MSKKSIQYISLVYQIYKIYMTYPARKRLEHGGVSLDPVRAEVSYRSKIVELSRNELLILRILMENAGSIISRSELMDELLGVLL